jgi:hypothetical protein
LLGTAIRQALVTRQAEIQQLVRRHPADAAEIQWDPTSASPLADTDPLERLQTTGLQAAIHLSGANVAAHRWTPAYKRIIISSRVDSTRALATMLASLSRPPQTLLVASATGIFGDRGDEILDERASTGKGFLADVCRQWEAAARPAVDAGIRVVHLRLGVVLARKEGALAKLLPLFRLGLGGRLGSGQQWMSWINLADAVAAIFFALDTPELAGPLNLTAPAPVTNAAFTRAIARAVHRPAVLPAPAFALRLALGEMTDETLLSSARAIPARLTAAGFKFVYPTIDEALAAALQPQR